MKTDDPPRCVFADCYYVAVRGHILCRDHLQAAKDQTGQLEKEYRQLTEVRDLLRQYDRTP